MFIFVRVHVQYPPLIVSTISSKPKQSSTCLSISSKPSAQDFQDRRQSHEGLLSSCCNRRNIQERVNSIFKVKVSFCQIFDKELSRFFWKKHMTKGLAHMAFKGIKAIYSRFILVQNEEFFSSMLTSHVTCPSVPVSIHHSQEKKKKTQTL